MTGYVLQTLTVFGSSCAGALRPHPLVLALRAVKGSVHGQTWQCHVTCLLAVKLTAGFSKSHTIDVLLYHQRLEQS